MVQEISLPYDFQIPVRYIAAIAQANDFSVNALGARWYLSPDAPDISGEVGDWMKTIRPEEHFLLYQVVSALVAPVFVWDCILNDGALQTQQITGFIPDYDGVIPPLLTWTEANGDLLNIKRVEDVTTLISLYEDPLIPPSSVRSGEQVSLPAEAFLGLLRIADSYYLSRYQALMKHTRARETLVIDDICRFSADPLYIRDKRWAFPAGLSTCDSDPDHWDAERMHQALSPLVHAGLIEVHDSGKELSLSREGTSVMNLFSPHVLRIISQESSMHADSAVINSAHWIIRHDGGIAMVQFGVIPPSRVLIVTADRESLRSYHQALIHPVSKNERYQSFHH